MVSTYNQHILKLTKIAQFKYSELKISFGISNLYYLASPDNYKCLYFTYGRRFQWAVDLNQSSVKIASGLDRTNDDLLTQINISAALDPVFKENLANDPFIR